VDLDFGSIAPGRAGIPWQEGFAQTQDNLAQLRSLLRKGTMKSDSKFSSSFRWEGWAQMAILCCLFLSCTGLARAQAWARTAPHAVNRNDAPLVPYQPRSHEAKASVKVELPPPTAWPYDVPNAPIDADEAARLGLMYQSNITIARYQIKSAHAVTQQARAGLLPTVSLGFNYSDLIESTSRSAISDTSVTGTSSTLGTTTALTSGVTSGTSSAGSTAASGAGIASTTSGTSSLTSGSSGVSTGTTTSTSGLGLSSSASNPYTLSATIRQLIWDFNHTRNLVREYQELETAAVANLTTQQSDTVYNVKQAYYGWVQADRLVAVNETNLLDQQEHLKEARALYSAGTGLASDVTTAETAVSEAVLNLTQAQVNASVARVSLTQQIGIDPRIPLRASASSEVTVNTTDPQILFAMALDQRPEIVYAQANIRSNDYSLKAAHTNNAPALSASLQYSAYGDKLYPQGSTANFLVGITWNPYDGGLTSARIHQSEANLGVAQQQLQNFRVAILSDVAQAYLNLKTAEQKIEAVKAQLESAQESLNISVGRYRVGLGLFLNVLDAQTSLTEAQANQVNAQASLDLARASLNHALGMPLPHGWDQQKQPPQPTVRPQKPPVPLPAPRP
jgi:outer membrane protein